jgi:hypothetical protein
MSTRRPIEFLATLLCFAVSAPEIAIAGDRLALPGPPCRPPQSTIRYLQAALDGWDLITRKIMLLPPEGLPWIVTFDRGCVYHVAADRETELGRSLARGGSELAFGDRTVEVSTARVANAVTLPNGGSVPIGGVAFTGLYAREGTRRPFFVVALPEVWATDPAYRDDPEDDWPRFVLDVLSHELVHTRQLTAIAVRLEALHKRIAGLPSALDDDLVQNRFASVPGFAATVRAEVALLHQAAAEPSDKLARELARRAVDLTRARRAAYFGADLEAWAAIEDLFLNMEGVASWAAFRRAVESAPQAEKPGVLDDIRDNRKWWSQEQGLALFLVIDRFARGWIRETLPPGIASPLDLLDRALSTGD